MAISLEGTQVNDISSTTEQAYHSKVNSVIDRSIRDAGAFIGNNHIDSNLSLPGFSLKIRDSLYVALKSLVAEELLRDKLNNFGQRRKFLDRFLSKNTQNKEVMKEALDMISTENRMALEQDKDEPVSTVGVIKNALSDLFGNARGDTEINAGTLLDPQYVKDWGQKWAPKLR